MGGVDPARLVFIDECGTHIAMTRRRARAPRGVRARGAVPRTRGPVTTLLAGVSLGGRAPAMTVEGGTDTAVFATYLERVLLPTLSAMSRAITGLPPEPGAELTPSGRRRRGGRPLKQKA